MMHTIHQPYPPLPPLPPTTGPSDIQLLVDYQRGHREDMAAIRAEQVLTGVYTPQRPISCWEQTVPGYREEVTVRLYRPQAVADATPAVLYMHGGAWCKGSIDTTHEYCLALADLSGALVVSVAYHLAPEFPYPHGIEDCYQVLCWMWKQAEVLGIDREDITLSGDSAGGNFSAGLSLMVRDRGEVSVKNQILLYPGLSMRAEDGVGGRDPDAMLSMQIVVDWYLGGAASQQPYITPLAAADLSGLPRTLLAVAALDGMRFCQRTYAQAIEQAGNMITVVEFENTPHGFICDHRCLQQLEDMAGLAADFIREKL